MIRKVTGVLILGVLTSALAYTGVVPRMVEGVTYAVESGKAKAAEDQLAHATWQNAFELAAQAVQPSIVSITSERTVKPAGLRQFRGRQFGEMFGDDFLNRFLGESQREYRQTGLGSGVIVDERGYILTNNHVIAQADQLTVHLSDNRTVPAKLVGTDPRTDVAVIKIETSGLHTVKLGDSDEARVGQWVMAVGSPFGLEHTVTAGIISAKGRANVGVADYEDFIQTDAAINQGNSGGPLLNLHGEVIGINTAILSRSGGNQGVGLAIPINMAREVMQRLISDGKMVRGWLGVAIQEMDEGLASSFGFKGTGILIGNVVKGGPAAKAGLYFGDIVMSLDGKDVKSVVSFRNHISQIKPGATVVLGVWRDGHEKKLSVVIGEAPASSSVSENNAEEGTEPVRKLDAIGIELSDVDRNIASQFNLPSEAQGALIASVASGSAGEKAGLRAGDLIIDVQGKAVSNATEAKSELAGHDLKNGVRLRVQRGDLVHFVFVKAAK